MTELFNDYTRRQMLVSLGGFDVSCPRGTFVGLFDDESTAIGEVAPVESSAPRLTCLTSDADRLRLAEGDWLRIGADQYQYVGRERDTEDAGFTHVQLHSAV